MKILPLLLALMAPALAAEPNQLSPEEKAAGFKLLFDGKTSDGWRGYKKEGFPEGWKVEDGTLTVTKGGGNLITKEQFKDFEFRFEFKISENGNSGIMWRVAETDGAPYMTGPEYQILDGHGKTGYANEIAKGNVSGAFYDFVPSKVEWCKPAAEWNEGSIKVQGTKVTLTVNGNVSAEVDTASDDWKQKLAKSKFASWPRFAREPQGFLCLQEHGDTVSFRSMRVKVLE